jgi:hypothetical protein
MPTVCDMQILTALKDGVIDSTTWHELLRPFIVVKTLGTESPGLLGELFRALQLDEVGSDPGFLPNLQVIYADLPVEDDSFTSFMDSCRVMGRCYVFLSYHCARNGLPLGPSSLLRHTFLSRTDYDSYTSFC